jgi:hypothetical protein
MKSKLNVLLSVLLVITLVLSGCSLPMGEKQSSTIEKNNQNSTYNEYYKAKVKYVGDNSQVVKLLKVLRVGDLGNCTIALSTHNEPYGLTINYSELKGKGNEDKFKSIGQIDYAFYLLALINNLSFVDVNYKTYNYHLDIENANKIINENIKTYGNSPEKLKELNNILNPKD